jgi:AraC-like DNA-binding protein
MESFIAIGIVRLLLGVGPGYYRNARRLWCELRIDSVGMSEFRKELDNAMPTGPTESPAVAAHSLSVFDPEELVEAVGSSTLTHTQLSGGPFRGELLAAQFDSCRVDTGRYSQTLISRGAFARDQVVIGCLLDAEQPGCINGYRFGRLDSVIFLAGAELDYLLPANTRWVALQLPLSYIEAICPNAHSGRGATLVPSSQGSGARFAGCFKALLDAIETGSAQPLGLRNSDAEWLESRLLDAACMLLTDDQRRGTARPNHAKRMSLLRSFERLAEGEAYRDLRIAEVAARLGVGQRTLELCFKDLLGLSPIQYLIRLRLNAIHHALMRSLEDTATVEAIARQHGVNHLSRFAAYYRAQFGYHPHTTLRRRFR